MNDIEFERSKEVERAKAWMTKHLPTNLTKWTVHQIIIYDYVGTANVPNQEVLVFDWSPNCFLYANADGELGS